MKKNVNIKSYQEDITVLKRTVSANVSLRKNIQIISFCSHFEGSIFVLKMISPVSESQVRKNDTLPK